MKIVLAGGCFDILHYGHIHFLKEAKKLGDQTDGQSDGQEVCHEEAAGAAEDRPIVGCLLFGNSA